MSIVQRWPVDNGLKRVSILSYLSCCYARVVSSRPTPSSLCAIPSFLSLACSTVPAFCPLQYRASFLPLAVPYPAFCPLQYCTQLSVPCSTVPSFLSLAVPYPAFCPLQYRASFLPLAVPCTQLSVPCSIIPSFLPLAVPCQLSAPCSTIPSFLSLAVPYLSLVPRALPDFISQLWRRIFEQLQDIIWSGLGMRLHCSCN